MFFKTKQCVFPWLFKEWEATDCISCGWITCCHLKYNHLCGNYPLGSSYLLAWLSPGCDFFCVWTTLKVEVTIENKKRPFPPLVYLWKIPVLIHLQYVLLFLSGSPDNVCCCECTLINQQYFLFSFVFGCFSRWHLDVWWLSAALLDVFRQNFHMLFNPVFIFTWAISPMNATEICSLEALFAL